MTLINLGVLLSEAINDIWGLRHFMSDKTVKFEFEKETKNSVRFKEVPEEGQPPIIGSLYVQKWYVGSAKHLEVSITKKD